MVEFTPAVTPTRVLHLIESDGVYGAEQVVLALARQAAEDPRFPAAVGCLVKDAAQPNALHERAGALGIPAFKLLLRNVQSAYDLLRFTRRLPRLGVGLVHAHGYKATIAAYAAHVTRRLPVLATCHLWFEDSQTKWTHRLLALLERRLYPRFPHVVAVSPHIARQLRGWGVRPDRLTEISNGVALDAAPTPAALDTFRRRVGALAGTVVVLTVGRLVEQKAQTDLIEAAGLLKAAHPRLRVLILGDGHLGPALEEQISRTGVGDCVQILGFQDNVREYLAIADIFALPSVDEGLPVALLEALAAGVAVVCTPVGAIPELLEDGVSAIFVPVHSVTVLAEALDRLIARPDLRRALAQRGQEVVRQTHTAKAMYGRYRDIYVRLAENR